MGSYYDIEAILTDAHKVPCTFEIDIPGLGYLDENPGGDIKAQQTTSLPLWLSTLLAVQRIPVRPQSSMIPSSSSISTTTNLCTLDLPSTLHPRVLNALKADPRTVDLRALSPQFYDVAIRILELFDDEDDEIADVLGVSFKARAAKLADLSKGTLRSGALMTATAAATSSGASSSGGGNSGSGGSGGDSGGRGGGIGGGGGIEGQEFLRGLDGMEESLFRAAHEGSKNVRVWLGEATQTSSARGRR